MAIKTITVTENAYDTIKRLKSEDESFSDLFLRLGERYLTINQVRGILNATPEDAAAFSKRVKQIREELGKGMEKRMENVRSRFKHNN